MSPPGRGARAPDRSIPRARVMLRAGSAPVADDRSPLGTARTALSEWREVVGILNAGTSMWETVSTNDLLLMVPSHFSHEIRLIRRNGAHYL